MTQDALIARGLRYIEENVISNMVAPWSYVWRAGLFVSSKKGLAQYINHPVMKMLTKEDGSIDVATVQEALQYAIKDMPEDEKIDILGIGFEKKDILDFVNNLTTE